MRTRAQIDADNERARNEANGSRGHEVAAPSTYRARVTIEFDTIEQFEAFRDAYKAWSAEGNYGDDVLDAIDGHRITVNIPAQGARQFTL